MLDCFQFGVTMKKLLEHSGTNFFFLFADTYTHFSWAAGQRSVHLAQKHWGYERQAWPASGTVGRWSPCLPTVVSGGAHMVVGAFFVQDSRLSGPQVAIQAESLCQRVSTRGPVLLEHPVCAPLSTGVFLSVFPCGLHTAP